MMTFRDGLSRSQAARRLFVLRCKSDIIEAHAVEKIAASLRKSHYAFAAIADHSPITAMPRAPGRRFADYHCLGITFHGRQKFSLDSASDGTFFAAGRLPLPMIRNGP